ncbi:MAG: 2-oxoacid:acceptor oxidoreductase family protein [Firmicutes bacterium]|nr:2-oxoacid:acceptor oxidoreductase family protein [Bacillota bacterium]
MMEEILIAGFGGQGVMVMGTLLAYAGMLEGRKVSWLPSYGPEMRGGTANCSVVISDTEVGSPVVTEPTSLIVMNRPSLDRFEGWLKPGGLLLYNSSLIDVKPRRADVRVIAIPTNEVANELGNTRVANMVALGAFLGATRVVGLEAVVASLKKVFPPRRHDLIPLNRAALERGQKYGG